MSDNCQSQSPEDKILESFLHDQVIFVDIVITRHHGNPPAHTFKGNAYVNGKGDVVCLDCGRCQLKFRLFWSTKEFQSVMFSSDAPLLIGVPCPPDGCPAAMADPPFHDMVRETTGQIVSVIDDNPGGTSQHLYAYQLQVVAKERGGTQQTIVIDPRIINR